MNKLWIPLTMVLLVLSGLKLNAQHHFCGHDLIMNQMAQQTPGYKEQVLKIFDEAKRRGLASRQSRNQTLYTIDLVIHVVWKDSSENLATSIIQGQVDQLNKDFRRLNADTANLRSMFHPVAGDAMIEFNLVQVNRVQTNEEFSVDFISGALPDNVKETANGGSDPWDTELYLNLWICKIQPITVAGIPLGQLLGYAYPPDGLSNWPAGSSAPSPLYEGVVVDFRGIGPNNPNPIDLGTGPLTVVGRTPVHEIGHYLGLRHVWGDGGGILGGNSCGEDDGVADTPNTAGQSNFDCDTTKNSCVDTTAIDWPDMVENYMDYAAETCMNTFTIGQIDIMRGVLEGPRCKLINNCITTYNTPTAELTSVQIYPNPAKGFTTLEFDNPDFLEYQITIRDVMGKEVLPTINGKAANAQHTVPLNGLANGIYFVEIASKEVTIGRKLVVSQ